jgi:integrase
MRRYAPHCAFYTQNELTERILQRGEIAYMKPTNSQFGSKHDERGGSQPPSTVAELLDEIERRGLPGNQIRMLRSTVARICECLGKAITELTIEDVRTCVPILKRFLQDRRYSRNSIRSYSNFVRILCTQATVLGCAVRSPELAAKWESVLKIIGSIHGCDSIARYAIELGREPATFSDADLDSWARCTVASGRCFYRTRHLKQHFRTRITHGGLREMFPALSFRFLNDIQYGTRVKEMPQKLQAEITVLLNWKQAPFAPGRPRRSRNRAITAKHLRATFERLYGFVTKIQGRPPVETIPELVTKDMINSYVEWCLNERKIQAHTLNIWLGAVYAAVRHFPAFSEHRFDWFESIFAALPLDDDSGKIERKAAKTVEYHELHELTNTLAKVAEEATSVYRARLCRNQLLLKWLITLPWRQRNLRECRIGTPSEANVFKSELPKLVHVATPDWVKERLRTNPRDTFWQFHFRAHETKTGVAVRGILPSCLIPLLEEYLASHRPKLLKGRPDPGTLFVNNVGKPFILNVLVQHVSETTLRYCGRRVTPHICRDIYAYRWLDDHPEDYLTLSKILWHSDVRTTLRIYGRNFDESNGAAKVDEWLKKKS